MGRPRVFHRLPVLKAVPHGGFGEAQFSLTISLALGRDRQLDTSAGP
jgi:hypothetical protein